MNTTTKIQPGDRVKFRAATRYAGAPILTRVVRDAMPSGAVTVRAHGYDHFIVKASEIVEHIPANHEAA